MSANIYQISDLKRIVIDLLNKSQEDEVFELKEMKNQVDKNELGKYFSALSNEASLKGTDCAWMLLGVKDNHDVVGTSALPNIKTRNELKKDLADQITNRITYTEIYELTLDGKRVIALQIPSSPGTVVTYKGIAYGREGESLSALNLDKINRIQHLGNDWSHWLNDVSIDDLDPEAIAYMREKHYLKNPDSADFMRNCNDSEFLTHINLMYNGRLTNAAVLLLGKSTIGLFGAQVWISWIYKKEDGTPLGHEHCTMPFLLAAEKVYSHIRNLTYQRVSDSLAATEMLTYDPRSIREMINNAIMHADYTKSMRIDVMEIRDDSIVVCNSGSFLPGDIDKVVLSSISSSMCRNRLISETLYKLGLVESVGFGIKRMFYSQAERGFPLPEYITDNDRVCVRMTGHVINESVATIIEHNDLQMNEIISLDRYQKNEPLTTRDYNTLHYIKNNCAYGNLLSYDESLKDDGEKPLSDVQNSILSYLRINGASTTNQISSSIDIPLSTATYNLKKLNEMGLVHRNGERRKTTWQAL